MDQLGICVARGRLAQLLEKGYQNGGNSDCKEPDLFNTSQKILEVCIWD